MTVPAWIAQAVLGETWPAGAVVVLRDPMELPFVTLQPGARVVTPLPVPRIVPLGRGYALVPTGTGAPADAGPVLAAAGTPDEAVALATAVLGRPPDLAVAGWQLSALGAAGQEVAARYQAALAGVPDPLALLGRAVSGLPAVVGRSIGTDADPVVWLDPLCCLREPGSATHLAAGAIDLGAARLGVPLLGGDRVRLSFEGAAPLIAAPAGWGVRRVGRDEVEIAGQRPGVARLDLALCGHATRIRAVGVVLPLPVSGGEAFGDPLDAYAGLPAGGSG